MVCSSVPSSSPRAASSRTCARTSGAACTSSQAWRSAAGSSSTRSSSAGTEVEPEPVSAPEIVEPTATVPGGDDITEDEFEEVIEMLQSGRVDPLRMVTHHFPLADIQSAFQLAREPRDAIKIIIDCQEF